jgi:hypothetical protein
MRARHWGATLEVGDELVFATSTEGGLDTWFGIGGMVKGNCS